MPEGSTYDVGAGLLILGLIVVPMGVQKLGEIKVRQAAVVSVLAFLVGVASVFGRRR